MLYVDSLRQAAADDFGPLIVSAQLGLAGIAALRGRAATGARLFGAGEALLAALGLTLFPRDEPVQRRAQAALHAALGPERWAALREAGRAWSLAEAIDAAERLATTIAAESQPEGR
jgi:hypothetical protein